MQTDSHLWADTFDRKLTDLFLVESEVAKAIADQLRVHLTGPEEQAIAAKPTTSRPTSPLVAATLNPASRPCRRACRAEISKGAGRAGPEIRARLGAVVIRRRD